MSKLPDYERRSQAFRLFVRLRNISQVSKEIGIPVATLHAWKKEEEWERKVAEMQSRIQGALQVYDRIETNSLMDSQVCELKLLEMLEKEAYDLLKNGTVKPSSWRDVLQTVDLVTRRRALITGQPTERINGAIDVTSMDEKQLDEHTKNLQQIVQRNFAAIDPATIPIDSPKEALP